MDANGGRDKGDREDADDSEVAYIARSKRDVAEHFGVAWSTMQPRLVGKIGAKVGSIWHRCSPSRWIAYRRCESPVRLENPHVDLTLGLGIQERSKDIRKIHKYVHSVPIPTLSKARASTSVQILSCDPDYCTVVSDMISLVQPG